MKFVYKIYSGYDGFQPRRIPERLVDKRYLLLGWKRYLDEVERGDDVWIYFHGPHGFKPGVYVKGRVASIDVHADKEVRLQVYNYDTTSSLIDEQGAVRIAAIVGARGRQVFLLPEDWETISTCTIFGTADTCSQRHCEWCLTWKSFSRIRKQEIGLPPRLGNEFAALVPAYWAIPPRCFLRNHEIKSSVHQMTQILKAFKTGNQNLAYPLARGIFEAIHEWNIMPEFDCIVPIPLSPDKAAKGEFHRTRLLAQELSALLGIPVKPLLKLAKAVSKRRMLSDGYTYRQFEDAYSHALQVEDIEPMDRILLVDDVCTYGGTLGVASHALRTKNPNLQICATTAVQMIVKAVVMNESSIST